MSKWSMRAMAAITLVAIFSGSFAKAATITASYINIQTSDNVQFNAAGNLANFGSNTAALASLPVGKFFRFGISLSVTNNPNDPQTVTDWAQEPAHAQPANLGLGQAAMVVLSTDAAGANIAAVQGNPFGGTGGRNASKAAVLGSWNFSTDPGDTNGDTSAGTANSLGSGQVGTLFQIFGGNSLSATADNGPIVGALASPGAGFFQSLMFKVVGSGAVTLSPQIYKPGTNVIHWQNEGDVGDPGDTTDDVFPSYSSDPFATSVADIAQDVGPLQINAGPPVPEPASLALLSLGLVGLMSRRRVA